MNAATSLKTVVGSAASTAPFDLARIRADFPILEITVNGKPLAYLDNAASAQMPQPVLDRLVQYQTREHANIHRAVHYLSETATQPTKVPAGRFSASSMHVKSARSFTRAVPPTR